MFHHSCQTDDSFLSGITLYRGIEGGDPTPEGRVTADGARIAFFAADHEYISDDQVKAALQAAFARGDWVAYEDKEGQRRLLAAAMQTAKEEQKRLADKRWAEATEEQREEWRERARRFGYTPRE